MLFKLAQAFLNIHLDGGKSLVYKIEQVFPPELSLPWASGVIAVLFPTMHLLFNR